MWVRQGELCYTGKRHVSPNDTLHIHCVTCFNYLCSRRYDKAHINNLLSPWSKYHPAFLTSARIVPKLLTDICVYNAGPTQHRFAGFGEHTSLCTLSESKDMNRPRVLHKHRSTRPPPHHETVVPTTSTFHSKVVSYSIWRELHSWNVSDLNHKHAVFICVHNPRSWDLLFRDSHLEDY